MLYNYAEAEYGELVCYVLYAPMLLGSLAMCKQFYSNDKVGMKIMKKRKTCRKLISGLVMAVFLIGICSVPLLEVQASLYGNVPKKLHIVTNSSTELFAFDFQAYGDCIKNLKTDSKNLLAKQILEQQDKDAGIYYGVIGLHAAKTGSYKLSFDIYKNNGQKKASYVIKVYANQDRAVNYVKLGNSTGKALLTGTSGKVQVSLHKGYQLKKIEYGVVEKGKVDLTVKEVKNHETITYGKYKLALKLNDTSILWYDGMFAETHIFVTYIDKYTGAEAKEEFIFNKW